MRTHKFTHQLERDPPLPNRKERATSHPKTQSTFLGTDTAAALSFQAMKGEANRPTTLFQMRRSSRLSADSRESRLIACSGPVSDEGAEREVSCWPADWIRVLVLVMAEWIMRLWTWDLISGSNFRRKLLDRTQACSIV